MSTYKFYKASLVTVRSKSESHDKARKRSAKVKFSHINDMN